jgi:NAD(P)-dependent dehydrogenase (short-subunit alcohol dehydrogenase family)
LASKFSASIPEVSVNRQYGNGLAAIQLALDHQYGILVMTMDPGVFNTPLLGRMPENVLQALGEMVPFPHRLGRSTEYAVLARHIIENPMLNGELADTV